MIQFNVGDIIFDTSSDLRSEILWINLILRVDNVKKEITSLEVWKQPSYSTRGRIVIDEIEMTTDLILNKRFNYIPSKNHHD